MAKVKFVESLSGISKAGREYSFVKLSDGLATFTVSNPKHIDMSKFVKGQDINVEYEVSAGYAGQAQPTISKVS